MNKSKIHFKICTHHQRDSVIEFLHALGHDLGLQTRSDAIEITDLSFEKGGVIAGFDDDQLIAMLGYFRGEPALDYANKEVGFIYVSVIAKRFRLSRTCWNGMHFAVHHLHEIGVKEVRCHASIHDPYTNKMYSHFAKPLGEDTTLRGRPAMLYGNSIENVLAYLDKKNLNGRARVVKRWLCKMSSA